jgi:N-acetylmuramate 1-kinase
VNAVMETIIDENVRSFLDENAAGFTAVDLLAGDASVRRYWRVRMPGGSRVLCEDPGFINANIAEYPFTVIYCLLRDVVPVPEIYAMDNVRGLFLLQDLGDDLMEYACPLPDGGRTSSIYRQCIDNLFRIQKIRGKGGAPFSLSFDVDKLMFEFDFFIEHALRGYFNAGDADGEIKVLRAEFLKIAEILYRPDYFVLAHRDYHSRNIIICGGIPYIIDFQDARMGLPQYDAVSLLRDSYIRLDDGVFEECRDYFYEGGRDMNIHSMGRDEFNYYFDVMAFQRNVKALGTFGYQVTTRGNKRYERYIAPTVAYLDGYAERQEVLEKAWRILRKYLAK